MAKLYLNETLLKNILARGLIKLVYQKVDRKRDGVDILCKFCVQIRMFSLPNLHLTPPAEFPCIEVVDGMISIIEGALIGTIVLTETLRNRCPETFNTYNGPTIF